MRVSRILKRCNSFPLLHSFLRPLLPVGLAWTRTPYRQLLMQLTKPGPEHMPERMPDRMPQSMPERMPKKMSERMSDRMSDRMPDRMLEYMSDRMPECQNNMSGRGSLEVFFSSHGMQSCPILNDWFRGSALSVDTAHSTRNPNMEISCLVAFR